MRIYKSISEFFDSKELKKQIGDIPKIGNIDYIDTIITKILANIDYISEYDVIKEGGDVFSFVKDYNDSTVNITVRVHENDNFELEVVNGETVDVFFKMGLSFADLIITLNSNVIKNIIN